MDRPTFYKIGNTRIKLSNIKDYSIGTGFYYFTKYQLGNKFLSDSEYEDLKRERDWTAERFVYLDDEIGRKYCELDYKLHQIREITEEKEYKCLRISTYQNDYFEFREDEIDIYKAFNDLDKYLT